MTAAKKKSIKITNSSAPSSSSKETIYVDVDDEITHIIDKVKDSNGKIVALVLPKRASVLQSLVNMKLLKRSAVNSKKNLVLITSETSLLPLAGAAGIHVAKSLQSKPVIPPVPLGAASQDQDEEEQIDPDNPALDKTAAVGALAAAAATHEDENDVIEFDNLDVDKMEPAPGKGKKKKNKKLKVPNFDRFRNRFFLIGLGIVLLIIFWYIAAVVMPKATVNIKTDSTSAVSSFDFTASTSQEEVDVDADKIPAVSKEAKKTETEKATATEEKNNGEKAKGSVSLKAKACAPSLGTPMSVPAGSTVTSNGKNFVTQSNLTFSFENFADGSCANYGTGSSEIVAVEQGAASNVASGSAFTVSNRAGVTGTGSTSGGSDKIVKIVSQKDIDDAVNRIKSRQSTAVQDELAAQLESEGQLAIKETLTTTE